MSHIFRAGACDSRDWVARLAAQPKMLVKVVEMLDLMENAQGDLRRADEAEPFHDLIEDRTEIVAEVAAHAGAGDDDVFCACHGSPYPAFGFGGRMRIRPSCAVLATSFPSRVNTRPRTRPRAPVADGLSIA